MGDSFQVHLFGYPGMEMMPECNGCMCYKRTKNQCFREISLFPLIHEFGVPGGLGVILQSLSSLGLTLNDFCGCREQA